MAWKGDTNNPVPSNKNENLQNKYFENTTNRAFDVRRDQDAKKERAGIAHINTGW